MSLFNGSSLLAERQGNFLRQRPSRASRNQTLTGILYMVSGVQTCLDYIICLNWSILRNTMKRQTRFRVKAQGAPFHYGGTISIRAYTEPFMLRKKTRASTVPFFSGFILLIWSLRRRRKPEKNRGLEI